jgi:oligoribonuclease (3'-5' exoribonuclease)
MRSPQRVFEMHDPSPVTCARSLPMHAMRLNLFSALWLLGLSVVFGIGAVSAADVRSRLLVHIDVETTGLTAGYHEMIDVGIALTDERGRMIDEAFIRMMPTFPERLDPGAAAVNGFSVPRWRSLGAVSEAEAMSQFIAFLTPRLERHLLIFTAFNAWFDQQFVAALMAEHGHEFRALFHYMVLDLPSMAWSLGATGLTGAALARDFGLDPETTDPLSHTGQSGVRFNVALYQAMMAEN